MAALPPHSPRLARAASVLAGAALVLAAAVGCTPEGAPPATSSPSAQQPPASAETPAPTSTSTPTPTPTAAPVTIPTDCRAFLSDAVLAELGDTPLNDPVFGPSGVQADGSLVCIWANPQADTTGLRTVIERMPRGEALDMLNALVTEEGFTCYTPDDGTRCEATWENAMYPVTDGRTLFWRDGILIDTTYSNLAPSGYTASIVAHIWG